MEELGAILFISVIVYVLLYLPFRLVKNYRKCVERFKKMTNIKKQKVKEDIIQDAKETLKQILKHPGLFK